MVRCTSCGESKTSNSFYPMHLESGKEVCRSCLLVAKKLAITEQECGKCKVVKPVQDFSETRRGNVGEYCRECMNECARDRYKSVRRGQVLESKYGIDESGYLELYVNQYGKCLICGTFQDVLHVDHNHATGEVRGLLCSSCNRGIGYLKENPDLLFAAAAYLLQSVDVMIEVEKVHG